MKKLILMCYQDTDNKPRYKLFENTLTYKMALDNPYIKTIEHTITFECLTKNYKTKQESALELAQRYLNIKQNTPFLNKITLADEKLIQDYFFALGHRLGVFKHYCELGLCEKPNCDRLF